MLHRVVERLLAVDDDRVAQRAEAGCEVVHDWMRKACFREVIHDWMRRRQGCFTLSIEHHPRQNYRFSPITDLPLILDVLDGHWYSWLLQPMADVDARDSGGRTALMWAAFTGEAHLARLLLERRANVELCGCTHPLALGLHVTSALAACAYAGPHYSLEVAELLLRHGASPEPPVVPNPGLPEEIWKHEWKMHQHGSYLSRVIQGSAGQAEKITFISMLLECSADVNDRTHPGAHPGANLYLASSGGQADVVQFLLEKGADPNIPQRHGTALLAASCGRWDVEAGVAVEERGFTEVVRLLVTHGARLEEPNAKGVTPLIAAAANGQAEVASLLIEARASVDARDHDAESPLEVSRRMAKKYLELAARPSAGNLDEEARSDSERNHSHDLCMGCSLRCARIARMLAPVGSPECDGEELATLMGKASMLRDTVDARLRKQLNFIVHVKDADPHRHGKNPFVGRPIAELRAAVEDALATSERHGERSEGVLW